MSAFETTVFGQFNLLGGMVNTRNVNFKIHNSCTALLQSAQSISSIRKSFTPIEKEKEKTQRQPKASKIEIQIEKSQRGSS